MREHPARAERRLKMATWNIHYGIGSDRRFDLGRIVAVLSAINADVVGLQEVGWHRRNHRRSDHFAYLREHTGYHVVAGLVRDPLRARFGNALLSRLPVRETAWIDLKVTGHIPRAAAMADLDAADGPLRVVVTHFGLAAWERERQARRLVEATAAGPGANLPTVLLGDFNILRARTRAAAVLAGHFPVCIREPTYPARRPFFRLDRIYLSAGWELAGAQVFRQGQAAHASDHLPLVAEARWAAREESAE